MEDKNALTPCLKKENVKMFLFVLCTGNLNNQNNKLSNVRFAVL